MRIRIALLSVLLALLSLGVLSSPRPSPATGPLGVDVTVTPTWRDPLLYPKLPPPHSWRVTARVTPVGTRLVFAAPEVELDAGQTKTATSTYEDLTVRLTATIDARGERATLSVRGEREGMLVLSSASDVWLERPSSRR